MMKITALFLAVYMFAGSLFPQADFGQLAKMGNIGKHYKIHRSEAKTLGEDVSFFHYLNQHYFQTSGHSGQSGHDHDGLPLLSLNPTHNFTHYYWSPLLKFSADLFEFRALFFYAGWLHREFINSFFRPPSGK